MLLFSPIVSLFALYIAVIYGYLYLLFTTITAVFEQTYGFSPGSVGLVYLGIGVGSLAGLVFQSLCSDRLFHSLTVRHGSAKPEYRLPPLFATCWFIPISLFWYGWTTERKVHWMAPIVGTSLLGFGMLNAFTTVSTYLVDAYTVYAASAVAATTVIRSLGGAFLPLAGAPMYASLGLAWGNSLLAFIALAMCPLPFIFYRYGERIRSATSVRL
jgi:type III secretory pathway component EscS